MNRTTIMVVGILLFMISTIALYIIGLKKKVNENKMLMKKLLNNGAIKVIKYLKRNGVVRKKEIEKIISDLKAKEWYSQKTATVQDERIFVDILIEHLIKNNCIVETQHNNEKAYVLHEKGNRSNG